MHMARLQASPFPSSPISSPLHLPFHRLPSPPLPFPLHPHLLVLPLSAATSDRRRLDGRRQTKERPGVVYEEDIYHIDKGFTSNLQSTEEMIELAGVRLPSRLKQQLQEERNENQLSVDNKESTSRLTHKMLKVIAGKAGGRKLLSPKDMNVRPMMEVVRGAVFDILQARIGGMATMAAARWLDLYSGTGSVGIEALSRGCASAHFVEMDPWIVAEVLKPNLEATKFFPLSVVHTMQVEAFLQRSLQPGHFGSFDFISVTPPYEAVDYEQLMGQLSLSPVVGEDTFMVVEYPSKLKILYRCGPLLKILDRQYGRTHLAIYGPEWAQKK